MAFLGVNGSDSVAVSLLPRVTFRSTIALCKVSLEGVPVPLAVLSSLSPSPNKMAFVSWILSSTAGFVQILPKEINSSVVSDVKFPSKK